MQQNRLMRAISLLALAVVCIAGGLGSATQTSPSLADMHVAAGGAWNVQSVGQMPYGRKSALVVRGQYAYLATGPSLVIVDISRPTTPEPVGWAGPLQDSVLDIALSGDYAYLAIRYHGLQIVDISDPAHPFEVGFYDTPGNAVQVAVAGGYAYVADENGGLRIVDVSNPHSLVETSFLYVGIQTTDVAVLGNYAFAATSGFITIRGNYAYMTGTFSVIDVSDPYAPREIGPLPLSLPGGLHIVDVSDPAHPVEVGIYTRYNAYYISAADAWGNRAYIGLNYGSPFDEAGRLVVLDLDDMASPVPRGAYNTWGSISAVSAMGNYVYITDAEKGLLVLDVSNPDAPVLVGKYLIPARVSDMMIHQDHLLITTGESLAVVNISDAGNPVELSFCEYDSIGEGGPLATLGNYAFVAIDEHLPVGRLTEILVINLAAPESPGLVGRGYSWLIRQNDLAAAGTYVYVVSGTGDGALQIVDVAHPEGQWMSNVVGTCRTPGDGYEVDVSQGYAYVADGRGGLRVIDVSDPTSPTEVGSFGTIDTAYHVVSGGSYAYVAARRYLQIIDVSDPALPRETGRFETLGNISGLALVQPYLYIAEETFGLRVLDISDPAHPREAGFYELPGGASRVAVDGDIVYVAGNWWNDILWVLRFPGEPEPTPTAAPTATPRPVHKIAMEAEEGFVMRPGMDVGISTEASQCGFVETKLGNQGSVTLTFYAPNLGNYAIWARVKAAGEYTGNSFFVSIDGAERFWHEFVSYGPTPLTWIWSRVHMYGRPTEERYYFSRGVHTIRFDGREMGARLDRILVTNDLSYTPGDQDISPCSLFNTPTATPTRTPLRPILPTFTPTRTRTPTPLPTPTPTCTSVPRASVLLPVIMKGP